MKYISFIRMNQNSWTIVLSSKFVCKSKRNMFLRQKKGVFLHLRRRYVQLKPWNTFQFWSCTITRYGVSCVIFPFRCDSVSYWIFLGQQTENDNTEINRTNILHKLSHVYAHTKNPIKLKIEGGSYHKNKKQNKKSLFSLNWLYRF